MYYVEIYIGEYPNGYWMYSVENIEKQGDAVDHWRQCLVDGYEARIGWHKQ